jgi:hypothetical protein
MGEYICPHCKKPIYDDEALLCLYCGENLKRGVGLLGKIKYPPRKALPLFLGIIIILSFLFYIFLRF